MLSKGQGRTMGSYYMLLYALAEDGRIDEALGSVLKYSFGMKGKEKKA
ncbi:hypothetical protein Tco_1454156, partial [Tanacetum coccineum]